MSGTTDELSEPENFEPGKMPVLNRFEQKKAFAKTKILPKAGKINFSILFKLEFE